MPPPSVILMGSKPGSVAALAVLLERGWDVRCVVTAKTRDAQAWLPSPGLRDFAASRGIPTLLQRDLDSGERVDFVISYMFRNLVKAPSLAMAVRGAFNFHAGPLPEFGGWAFYNVAILEGATEYGVTCHWMDEGFDTGPLFRVPRFPIDTASETALSLERRAQREMIRLFVEFCEIAESGAELPKIEQDRSRHRYMRQEEFEALKRIPADADAETVDRIARAFWYPPYECAYIETAAGHVEVVPEVAKTQLARALHTEDLRVLLEEASGALGRTVTVAF